MLVADANTIANGLSQMGTAFMLRGDHQLVEGGSIDYHECVDADLIALQWKDDEQVWSFTELGLTVFEILKSRVALTQRAREILGDKPRRSRVTAAMRYALHLACLFGHLEWAMYPASFKRLAALDLLTRDEEGWATPTKLGREANRLIDQDEAYS